MPRIKQEQVNGLNDAALRNGRDVEAWSENRLGSHFLSWFNEKLAGQGAWAGVALVDTPANRDGFQRFWNQIETLAGGTAEPFQFLALMGIFANECRANFTPMAERMGRPGFPGLTYLFDAIPDLKRSYNVLAGNRTAFQCFHNADFNVAHGGKALGERLRETADARWDGPVYPRDVPFDNVRTITGYVMEADFMKFRGRGFVQTTGRGNYAKLISFVQGYKGEDAVIRQYGEQWAGKTTEAIAFASSNADWDRLFQETGLLIAAEAIRIHNKDAGDYLALSGDPDRAILNMGRRISGGAAYARKYRDRMEQLIVQVLT